MQFSEVLAGAGRFELLHLLLLPPLRSSGNLLHLMGVLRAYLHRFPIEHGHDSSRAERGSA
jgi:hypothetical protein